MTVHLKMSSLEEWLSQRVVGGVIFGHFFLLHFFLWFWKLDLHFSANFWLTRAPQPRLPSSSAPAAASSGRVGRRWLARGHGPGSSLLCGAREGHTPPFSGCARRQPVIRRQISVWVVPVTACVLHAPPSGILAFSPTAGSLFWVFFACVFSLVSPISACLCLDQILWEYLLANC
jgi:hypothetical protein